MRTVKALEFGLVISPIRSMRQGDFSRLIKTKLGIIGLQHMEALISVPDSTGSLVEDGLVANLDAANPFGLDGCVAPLLPACCATCVQSELLGRAVRFCAAEGSDLQSALLGGRGL